MTNSPPSHVAQRDVAAPAQTRAPRQGAPTRRSQLDLLTAQVRAIDAWNRSNRLAQGAETVIGLTREMRLDLNHRLEARRREQAAMVARVDEQLRCSGQLLGSERPLRAVLAHRNDWLCGKVRDRLEDRGVSVVAVLSDGAVAAGTVVAEQPDLVFVEDRLPSLAGGDLVRRVRDFSPLSVVGAQVEHTGGIARLVDVGAHAVFTRRVPPVEMADQLLACVVDDARTITLP